MTSPIVSIFRDPIVSLYRYFVPDPFAPPFKPAILKILYKSGHSVTITATEYTLKTNNDGEITALSVIHECLPTLLNMNVDAIESIVRLR